MSKPLGLLRMDPQVDQNQLPGSVIESSLYSQPEISTTDQFEWIIPSNINCDIFQALST